MMKKYIFSALLLMGIVMGSSPAGAKGLLYTNAVYPVTATSNVCVLKSGQATATNVLGLIEIGDAGIQKASMNGGITKIHHVDMKDKSFLFLFCKKTTIVYGE